MKNELKKKIRKFGTGLGLLGVLMGAAMTSELATAAVVSSGNYVSEWKLVTDNNGYLGFMTIEGQEVGIVPQGVVQSGLVVPDNVNGNLWACLQPLFSNTAGTAANVYNDPNDIGLSVNLNRMFQLINVFGYTNNSVGKKYSDPDLLSDFLYMNAAIYGYEVDLAAAKGIHINDVLGVNDIPDSLNLLKMSESGIYNLLKKYVPHNVSAALSSARSQDEWAKATAKAIKSSNKDDLTNDPIDEITKNQTVTSRQSSYLTGGNPFVFSDTKGVSATVSDGKFVVTIDSGTDLAALNEKVVTFKGLSDIVSRSARAGIPPVSPEGEVGVGTTISKNQYTDSRQKMGIWTDPPFVQFKVKVIGTGDVKITKTDEKTGDPIAFVEFEVKEDSGTIHTVKTNSKGEAVVSGIVHDTVVDVTEKNVPEPYILGTDNTKRVTIKAGETSKVEFKNEKTTGKTTLTKQDKTTETSTALNLMYPMTGAKYGLFKDDDTLVKEFTLKEDLTATIDQLELGGYYWKETVAPIGYVLDTEKHTVELTYKDQYTAVVVKNATSQDDVIRMNIDGQKLIQNDTNEIFKNGVEFTLTNKRTNEEILVETSTVDGKKGYFQFFDLPIDDYILTETKGVEGYKNVDPIEILHSYDKESASFTFTIKDQKSGNILTEETFTQLELSKGENVDLGTYTLKDKAEIVEKPLVGISTKAHVGDGKTNSFVWGDDVQFYDDVTITHENIAAGTERAYETILVAVYPDGTTKDVWTSGKVDYTVTDKETTEKVIAEYDYKQDPEGTEYYFKELGYGKPSEKDYEEDTNHNLDGEDKNQWIYSTVKTSDSTTTSTTTVKEQGTFPSTGEKVGKAVTIVGVAVIAAAVGFYMVRKRKEKQKHADGSN